MNCLMCGCESQNEMKCEVCGATRELNKLNTLVVELTAFNSWLDMVNSMKTGYVPSIYSCRNRKHKELAKLVREQGFKVYDGQKVA
jgi:hypothetical protein